MTEDECLHIISSIAAGEDPYTDGVTSANRPENNPTTVQALCVAVSILLGHRDRIPADPRETPFDAVLEGKLPLEEATRGAERETILKALELNRYNKTTTAESLGMTYRTLRYKLKLYGID